MQSILEYHSPTVWDRPFLLDYLWSRGYRFVRAGATLSYPETWSAITVIEHAPTPRRALELLPDSGFAMVHYAGEVTDAVALAALADAFELMQRRGLTSLADVDRRWSVNHADWVSRIKHFFVSLGGRLGRIWSCRFSSEAPVPATGIGTESQLRKLPYRTGDTISPPPVKSWPRLPA